MKDMDHSKMSKEAMKNMDHSKMSKDDIKNMGHDNIVPLNSSKGKNEITFPEILKPASVNGNNVSYTITAQQGKTEFYPGHKSNTFGYNGNLLGPVVKLKNGQHVTINLVNHLNEDTTFHFHGLEIPGDVDGGPEQVLKPGEEKTISFKVNQEAATLWFHPHPSPHTAEQVYKGLAGLIYIEDNNNNAKKLPHEYGVNDFPLIIQDKSFDSNKQLDYKKVKNDDGTTGHTVLVNGKVDPKFTFKKELVRLRILDASNARVYKLKFDNGMKFEHIASDGGYLNKPDKVSEIQTAPSERNEILVDFSKVKGNKVNLINEDGKVILPIHLINSNKGTKKSDDKISNLSLNNIHVSPKEKEMKITKKVVLAGMGKDVTINGKKFDKNRIDFNQKVNKTEIWEIENKKDAMGGMEHTFHIHGTQFKVISVDGKTPLEEMQGYKDTISLEPGQKVKIAVKFNHKGIYMYHCHTLEHEDNGMMGQIKVS
ncbi:multicopper oxidase family protein [Scopulibacillus cellulosilyticus]|uniref:Multicopper oxidase family protein n=1 Tax=Scopulibacillus cellulosilyticus TaxID=2665665 RepID=A0ABW2Q0R8_9BACL